MDILIGSKCKIEQMGVLEAILCDVLLSQPEENIRGVVPFLTHLL